MSLCESESALFVLLKLQRNFLMQKAEAGGFPNLSDDFTAITDLKRGFRVGESQISWSRSVVPGWQNYYPREYPGDEIITYLAS